MVPELVVSSGRQCLEGGFCWGGQFLLLTQGRTMDLHGLGGEDGWRSGNWCNLVWIEGGKAVIMSAGAGGLHARFPVPCQCRTDL